MKTLSLNNKKMKALQRAMKAGRVPGCGANDRTASFDIPAGHTCPMADVCHSRVVVNAAGSRVIEDLGNVRCYAVKAEKNYTATFEQHNRNLELTKDAAALIAKVEAGIAADKVTVLRIHSAGDMYNWAYFQTWREIARRNPSIKFWAYSKQATFVKYSIDNPLPNMRMVYSHGGLMDAYATKNNLPTCYIRDEKTNDIVERVKHSNMTLEDGTIIEVEHAHTQYNEAIHGPILCGSETKDHEDFSAVWNGETFTLDLH